MKLYLLSILLFVTATTFSKNKEENKTYNETFRDQFHFSPEINRAGSPIAIWNNDSVYHFFYQYNPFNLLSGYVNWGQATSTDLVHWKNQVMAITQPVNVSDSMQSSPWWGSVGSKNNQAVVWYNRWNDGIFKSTELDEMQFKNEVATIGTEKLIQSEPFVFWYEPDQKWVMLAYNRVEKKMYVLNANDGLNWKEVSSFAYSYGFPQLIQLKVDRKPDVSLWVLLTEKGTYMLGDFDGENFSIKSPVKSFNHAKTTGGTVAFSDKEKKRVLLMSQLECKQQADLPSNGIFTFPTQIELHEYETGIELVQQPIAEIETLHLKGQHWENQKIYPGLNDNLLKRVKGMEFHIKGEIVNLNSDHFGFLVRSNKEQKGFEISYNVKQGILTVMGNQVDYKISNNKLEFELLIDRSSVECYLDGGRYVFSAAFTPSPESTRYELFTSGGEVMVNWLDIFEMKSIWESN